ncbi:FHA domain-containing protein [Parachitinimonas caeni]|uniref:FHA domain-containing protein n=1 Tax=Parachitinimonas caeni TaxID=3031301 RepID=A0ABT7DT28_9NEIS|nr:FHA domain-containing protein [Parachitinimonas caeni]MDK2123215.1 FHA domain-containing protein [Parachitinimonas caeni]
MAKLILSLDGMVLREFKLDKEKVKIGRKPHNDLQIDNLAVSGEHALVTTIQNDSFLEDLNSTNGTLVNGNPVQKHFLQDNDVVEIGKYKLKYMREASAAKGGGEDFDKTMVIRSPMAAKPAAPSAPPAAEPPPPKFNPDATQIEQISSHGEPTVLGLPPEVPAAAIKVLNGANAGKTLDLVKNLTSLGKPGVQVAIITKRPNGYFLTHVEGSQFPTVNGEPVGTQAHVLKDHDVIELAGIKMELFYK